MGWISAKSDDEVVHLSKQYYANQERQKIKDVQVSQMVQSLNASGAMMLSGPKRVPITIKWLFEAFVEGIPVWEAKTGRGYVYQLRDGDSKVGTPWVTSEQIRTWIADI